MTPADVDVIVLAGGLGTRARPYLGDIPKFLADVRGEPLGLRLLRWLCHNGVRRVVLALGYGADRIERAVGNMSFPAIDLMAVRDPEPEGELMAIRHAIPFTTSPSILVMNGDTLSAVHLDVLVNRHDAASLSAYTTAISIESMTEHGVRLMSKIPDYWPPPLNHEEVSMFLTSRPFVDVGTRDGYDAAQSAEWIDRL